MVGENGGNKVLQNFLFGETGFGFLRCLRYHDIYNVNRQFQTFDHIRIPISIVTQMPVDDSDSKVWWGDFILLYEITNFLP